MMEALQTNLYSTDTKFLENNLKNSKELKEKRRMAELKRRAIISEHYQDLKKMVSKSCKNKTTPTKKQILENASNDIAKIKMLKNSNLKTYLDKNEVGYLYNKTAGDFFFLAECETGKMIHVSDSIQSVLPYSSNEWMNHSLFEFLHQDDIIKVKEQLNPKNKESLIYDQKTGVPRNTLDSFWKRKFNSIDKKCSFTCRFKSDQQNLNTNKQENKTINLDILSELGIWSNNHANSNQLQKSNYTSTQVYGYLGPFLADPNNIKRTSSGRKENQNNKSFIMATVKIQTETNSNLKNTDTLIDLSNNQTYTSDTDFVNHFQNEFTQIENTDREYNQTFVNESNGFIYSNQHWEPNPSFNCDFINPNEFFFNPANNEFSINMTQNGFTPYSLASNFDLNAY